MTHDDLVSRGVRWLLNTKRCKLVVEGPRPAGCDEYVDAIGWLPSGESIVLEAKVSASDFARDFCKPWRKVSTGMGMYRYYIVPPDLEECADQRKPDHVSAGLLSVTGKQVRVVVESPPRQQRDFAAEIRLLLAQASDGRRVVKIEQSDQEAAA